MLTDRDATIDKIHFTGQMKNLDAITRNLELERSVISSDFNTKGFFFFLFFIKMIKLLLAVLEFSDIICGVRNQYYK